MILPSSQHAVGIELLPFCPETFDLEMFAELRDKGIIFLKEDEQNKRLFQIGDGYGEERAERHGRENYI